MTLKDFETLKIILDKFGIYYEEGKNYNYNDEIVGSWLTIPSQNFETEKLSKSDIDFNEN